VKQALLAATTTPQHHHVQENEHDEDDEMLNGDVSRDLATDDNIIDPIEERRTLAERNERLHDQLKVKPCKILGVRIMQGNIRFCFEYWFW
jgi:radixin